MDSCKKGMLDVFEEGHRGGTGSVDVISSYVMLSNQSESLYAAEGAGLSSD